MQTSALDGETDLKTRVIPPACAGIELELLHKIKARSHFTLDLRKAQNSVEIATDVKLCPQGVIECPHPDKDIRRFDANMRLFPPFLDNDVCPLTIKNTILQSCYLRNTEWVCGVAVYAGKFYFSRVNKKYSDIEIKEGDKRRWIWK